MNRIMIVGCPGSGKSTLSKRIGARLNVPVLHLDYIYHIDNFKHISREELKEMIVSFTSTHKSFIIDGNYGSTLEWRTQFCDTVILLDIDTDICVRNVLHRMNEGKRDDMAPGFDNEVMDEGFLDFVKGFKKERLPSIISLLNRLEMNVVRLQDYEQIENFLNNLK